MKVAVYDNKKKKIEDIDLKDDIFGVEINEGLLHQVVLAQLAGKRAGTASTKDRGEVSGSTKKLFKQKGTGNARPGSIKSPLQYGGGIVFGPHPRSFAQKVNKKEYKNAIRSAIADRIKSGSFYVVNEIKLPEAKTKTVSTMLKSFDISKCLIVDIENPQLKLSSRNIYGVKAVKPEQVTPYDILKYENVLLTKAALEKLSEYIS
ncbi:MAG TPA: 50S ribosomal protein L4 [bacterium]|nr:50S ribosomal protein L4 [bacterium]